MTPLSETTILVPKLVGGGLTVGEHVRNMFWTAGPALGISLVLFMVLGLNADPDAAISTDAARAALAAAFNISWVNLLPLVLLVVFAARRFPPFLSILGSALFAGILAPFTQWDAVKAFVDDPSLGSCRHLRSRPSTARWRPGSSATPASSRSTRCSPAAGWRAC